MATKEKKIPSRHKHNKYFVIGNRKIRKISLDVYFQKIQNRKIPKARFFTHTQQILNKNKFQKKY